jgi:cellulose synthase/poly-beta-1,6-N-acetylglucosamine synthase-like glycosyltransferase
MINIIITSYNEPKSTVKAVRTFLNQKDLKEKFKILVVDPFPETHEFLKKEFSKEMKKGLVEFFLDPGEGKAYALNILFQDLFSKGKNDVFILTDGDVYVSDNTVSEIMKKFSDEKVGCVTGRPISVDSRNKKYGLWAKVLFAGVDKTRRKLSRERKFFECSGYLFAIRNGVLTDFPMETSEDSIIPYLFWKKGYRVEYADRAEVYVKNPGNWKDWLNQKIRNIKAHENLSKIAPDMPRTKSLFNEIREGAFFAIKQARDLKEFFWIIQLYFARLYLYIKAFSELRKKTEYKDGWRETEIESTKPLD